MAPCECRIVTEYMLTGLGTVSGFALCILGLFTYNYHTILWGWFSGFCALQVFVLQKTFLLKQFHDKYDPEQISKLMIIAAYLLFGTIIVSAYYLAFAIIYNNSFSLLNQQNAIEDNYWPPLISSTLTTLWLSLLLLNCIIYRKYLLTHNIPNIRSNSNSSAQESTPLLE